jgi:hypothetical protein
MEKVSLTNTDWIFEEGSPSSSYPPPRYRDRQVPIKLCPACGPRPHYARSYRSVECSGAPPVSISGVLKPRPTSKNVHHQRFSRSRVCLASFQTHLSLLLRACLFVSLRCGVRNQLANSVMDLSRQQGRCECRWSKAGQA